MTKTRLPLSAELSPLLNHAKDWLFHAWGSITKPQKGQAVLKVMQKPAGCASFEAKAIFAERGAYRLGQKNGLAVVWGC